MTTPSPGIRPKGMDIQERFSSTPTWKRGHIASNSTVTSVMPSDPEHIDSQTLWAAYPLGDETHVDARYHELRTTATRSISPTAIASSNSAPPAIVQPEQPTSEGGKQRAAPPSSLGDAHDLVVGDNWDWSVCGTTALVRRDWQRLAHPGEINLERGDFVTIVAGVSELWWYGTNRDGASGLFPRGNVDVLSDEAVRSARSLNEARAAASSLPLLPPQPATTPASAMRSGGRVGTPEPPLPPSSSPSPKKNNGAETKLAGQYEYIDADELYGEPSPILEALESSPAMQKSSARHNETRCTADAAASAAAARPLSPRDEPAPPREPSRPITDRAKCAVQDATRAQRFREDLLATRVGRFDEATLRCFTQLLDMGYGDSVGPWTLADQVEACKGSVGAALDRLVLAEEQRRESRVARER